MIGVLVGLCIVEGVETLWVTLSAIPGVAGLALIGTAVRDEILRLEATFASFHDGGEEEETETGESRKPV